MEIDSAPAANGPKNKGGAIRVPNTEPASTWNTTVTIPNHQQKINQHHHWPNNNMINRTVMNPLLVPRMAQPPLLFPHPPPAPFMMPMVNPFAAQWQAYYSALGLQPPPQQ